MCVCVCVFIVFPFLLKFDNQSFYPFEHTVKVLYRGIIDGHYSELQDIKYIIYIFSNYDNKLCCRVVVRLST